MFSVSCVFQLLEFTPPDGYNFSLEIHKVTRDMVLTDHVCVVKLKGERCSDATSACSRWELRTCCSLSEQCELCVPVHSGAVQLDERSKSSLDFDYVNDTEQIWNPAFKWIICSVCQSDFGANLSNTGEFYLCCTCSQVRTRRGHTRPQRVSRNSRLIRRRTTTCSSAST